MRAVIASLGLALGLAGLPPVLAAAPEPPRPGDELRAVAAQPGPSAGLRYRGDRITGRVLDDGCRSGRRVVVLADGDRIGTDRTGTGGRWEVPTTPRHGRLVARVLPTRDCRGVRVERVVPAPGLSLVRTPAGLSGALVARPGACVRDRVVEVLRDGVGAATTTSGADGAFELLAPVPGEHVARSAGSTRCEAVVSAPVVVAEAVDPGPGPTPTPTPTPTPPPTPTPAPTPPPGPAPTPDPLAGVARVAVESGGVLLPGPGASSALVAQAFDADGTPLPLGPSDVTWSVRDPGVLGVDAAGLATGLATGSTAVVATVRGVRSPESIAVVLDAAPGTVLVDDDRFAEPPTTLPADPARPDAAPQLRAVLVGVDPAPAVGDLLLSTGTVQLAGRVVGVTPLPGGPVEVVLEQVSMREALGDDFDLDGAFDLAGGEMPLAPGVEDVWDVERVGDVLRFDPLPGATTAPRERRTAQRTAGCARKDDSASAPLVCTLFNDLVECEISGTGITSLPFRLAVPPAFDVGLSPSLDTTELAGESFRFVAQLKPSVVFRAELRLEAAVEFKAECKVVVAKPTIPAPGALGFFLAGIVPLTVGFEVNPKLTVADVGVGIRARAGATARVGAVCTQPAGDPAPPEDCDLVLDAALDSPTVEPTTNRPSLAQDARLKISSQAFVGAELAIGPPALPELQLEVGGLKLGPKVESDLATRSAQVATADYASSVKATLPLDLVLGRKLGAVARLLGIGELKAVEKPLVELELDATPAGTLVGETVVDDQDDVDDTDAATMDVGDQVRFTGTLANSVGSSPLFPDPTTFVLDAFGIDEVLLVDSFGDVVSRQPGVPGKREYVFDLDVVFQDDSTNGDGQVKQGRFDDLFLFVDTGIPLDLLGLEVARASVAAPPPPPVVEAASSLEVQSAFFVARIQGREFVGRTPTNPSGSIGWTVGFPASPVGSIDADVVRTPTSASTSVSVVDDALTRSGVVVGALRLLTDVAASASMAADGTGEATTSATFDVAASITRGAGAVEPMFATAKAGLSTVAELVVPVDVTAQVSLDCDPGSDCFIEVTDGSGGRVAALFGEAGTSGTCDFFAGADAQEAQTLRLPAGTYSVTMRVSSDELAADGVSFGIPSSCAHAGTASVGITTRPVSPAAPATRRTW